MRIAFITILLLTPFAAWNQQCYNFDVTNSALPGNNVEGIYIANDNSKWIATSQGAAHFTDSSWVVYDITNSGLTTNWIKEITIDNFGNVWFASVMEGVFEFDGTNWIHFTQTAGGLPSNTIYDIYTDAAGIVWITTTNGIAYFDGSAWDILNTSNTSGFPSPTIFDIEFDNTGTIWMSAEGAGPWTGGASFFNSPTSCTNYTTVNSGISDNATRCITQTGTNQYWIGTLSGISVFDNNLNTWTTYNTLNSPLPSDYISDIEIDNNNMIWVGSNLGFNQGLNYFDNNLSTWFGPITNINSCLGSNTIKDIEVDALGNIWIATTGGATVYNLSTIQTSSVFNSIALINSTTVCNGEQTYALIDANGGFGSYNFDIVGIGSFQNWLETDTIWFSPTSTANYQLTNVTDALGETPINIGSPITVNVNASYFIPESPVICNGTVYTLPNGNTATTAGVYYSNFSTVNGCDSIYETSLFVVAPNVSVNTNDATITSNASSVTYQWVDCTTNYTPILGETSQEFTATNNGSYAVIIYDAGCNDTSACVLIDFIGLDKINSPDFVVYPNPFSENITLTFDSKIQDATITICNLQGQEVFNFFSSGQQQITLPLDLENGIYILEISSAHNNYRAQKILVKT